MIETRSAGRCDAPATAQRDRHDMPAGTRGKRSRRASSIVGLLALFGLLVLSLAGCDDASTPPDTRMMPWRGDDGRFGFVDPDDERSLVEPRLYDARPGRHGFAPIAAADHRWGLVDANGETVLPTDYAVIELIDTPRAALVVTKEEYNAWWRVSDWRLWPDFNILSTSHNGPTLVTYVPRAVWTVRNPATGETLYRSDRPDRGMSGSGYWRDGWQPNRFRPDDIWIGHWPDGAIVVNDTLYATDDAGHLSAVAHDIRDRLAGGDFLQRIDAKRHRRVNADGQPVDTTIYTERHAVPFETERGDTIKVARSDIFEDDAGRDYLFPDLSRPLPKTLPGYRFDNGERITAQQLASRTAVFAPVPNSRWFLLVSRVTRADASEPGTLTFLVDGDGRWAPGWQPRPGFYSMLADGRLLFRYAEPYGVLSPDLTFAALPMRAMGRNALGAHRYAGTDREGRQGIYDSQQHRWVFRAANVSIDSEPLAPGRVDYRARTADDKPTGQGLIDIDTGEIVLPPTYVDIEADGRVRLERGDGETIHFYIDLQTGREYRDGGRRGQASTKQVDTTASRR